MSYSLKAAGAMSFQDFKLLGFRRTAFRKVDGLAGPRLHSHRSESPRRTESCANGMTTGACTPR
jgi:hypothetical protein